MVIDTNDLRYAIYNHKSFDDAVQSKMLYTNETGHKKIYTII